MTLVDGAKLRRLREARGLSQEAVAFGAQSAGFKLSTSRVRNIEKGVRSENITIRTLDALAAGLNIPDWNVLLQRNAA